MFHRIVVATDFSECTQGAWELAMRIGAAPGSEQIVTHVLTEVPRYGEGFFNRALLGLVAARVVRLAPRPVLTVREPPA